MLLTECIADEASKLWPYYVIKPYTNPVQSTPIKENSWQGCNKANITAWRIIATIGILNHAPKVYTVETGGEMNFFNFF